MFSTIDCFTFCEISILNSLILVSSFPSFAFGPQNVSGSVGTSGSDCWYLDYQKLNIIIKPNY